MRFNLLTLFYYGALRNFCWALQALLSAAFINLSAFDECLKKHPDDNRRGAFKEQTCY